VTFQLFLKMDRQPCVIAREIVEDLQAALEQFAEIVGNMGDE